MKKILLLAILIVTGSMIIWSQVPQAMTYKAVAKDDWGVALPNKTITLRFTILQGSGTGTLVYQEKHTTTTNKFGLMDVEIGKGTPLIGSFDGIEWSTGTYYIQIEMDPNGGTNFRLEDPAHQLLSIPYALFAESSGNTSYTETDPLFTSSPSSGIWSSDILNWNTAFSWGNHANAGYLKNFTESDPIFLFHPAHGITNDNISNWNTAFSWGNHAGLYKPVDYFPAWNEIINKPTFASIAVSGNYDDLINKPTGNNIGDMQYWNGSEWVIVPVGMDGQVLTMRNGIPTWIGSIILTTTAISGIKINEAKSGGEVTSDGGFTITSKGVCWSTNHGPTISDQKTDDGPGIGSFTSSLTGLILGNTYYVRAYATNNLGTAYGNEISFSTEVAVGDSYQGGIVAYILQIGDPGWITGETHGLIAAPSDQGSEIPWQSIGSSYILTSANGIELGSGNANTSKIVSLQGEGIYAAKLCYDLVLNGFDDWYLPSKDELNALYTNRLAIGGFKTGAYDYYWSSTEYGANGAWWQCFELDGPYMGVQNGGNKLEKYNVRAIRSF